MFSRQPNLWGFLAFQIVSSVPFLYELRALLDWACTATTLRLFDWLKVSPALCLSASGLEPAEVVLSLQK